eukprot:scaffold616_cov306-Pavlova_lutheri.AAC.43
MVLWAICCSSACQDSDPLELLRGRLSVDAFDLEWFRVGRWISQLVALVRKHVAIQSPTERPFFADEHPGVPSIHQELIRPSRSAVGSAHEHHIVLLGRLVKSERILELVLGHGQSSGHLLCGQVLGT